MSTHTIPIPIRARVRGCQRERTHDVGRGGDGGEATGADVDGKSNEGADERAELEDSPENGEGLALVLLERVGQHDGALGGPEQRVGDPEDGSGKDEEPAGVLRLVAVDGK